MKQLLPCALAAALALPLSAATNATDELPPIVVEGTPISKYRAETVSTATLFDAPPEEIHAVVDVLTEDFIDEMNPTDLHDLLRHQAGVFTAGGKSLQDRSPGLFTLRGFGGTEAKLDGTLGFSGAMALFMDPWAFERVEIATGPVGATIGGPATRWATRKARAVRSTSSSSAPRSTAPSSPSPRAPRSVPTPRAPVSPSTSTSRSPVPPPSASRSPSTTGAPSGWRTARANANRSSSRRRRSGTSATRCGSVRT